MPGQYDSDSRPTITFPAAERHRPLAGIKLYCLVNRGTCVNCLPSIVTWQRAGQELNQQPHDH